mmetsp:Transcript_65010/g.125508  ORF Transcript_65010/g.125508 Transcript_65010/m.125508 type:complete len:631 (-) Transcript_65010:151-2043(-)
MGQQASAGFHMQPGVPQGFQPEDRPALKAKYCAEDGSWGNHNSGNPARDDSRYASDAGSTSFGGGGNYGSPPLSDEFSSSRMDNEPRDAYGYDLPGSRGASYDIPPPAPLGPDFTAGGYSRDGGSFAFPETGPAPPANYSPSHAGSSIAMAPGRGTYGSSLVMGMDTGPDPYGSEFGAQHETQHQSVDPLSDGHHQHSAIGGSFAFDDCSPPLHCTAGTASPGLGTRDCKPGRPDLQSFGSLESVPHSPSHFSQQACSGPGRPGVPEAGSLHGGALPPGFHTGSRPPSPGGRSVGTMSMMSEAHGFGSNGPAGFAVGSMAEAFSATTGRWYQAKITDVQRGADGQDVLTVQFYMDDVAKQKSMYRADSQLAPYGTHTGGQLPPGFETRPSQSRPGQMVYLDMTTGTKYAVAELAWRVHFERMQNRPAVGMETVCAMPGHASSSAAARLPPCAAQHPLDQQPQHQVRLQQQHQLQQQMYQHQPARPMTLAELQAGLPLDGFDAGRGAAGAPLPHGASVEMEFGGSADVVPGLAPPHLDPTLGTAGKVALPAFGDALGSQAAYLRYESKDCTPFSEQLVSAVPLQPVSSAAAAGYRPSPGAAPRREAAPKRGRNFNPALQAWQEDAFSEWRN